MAKTFKKPTTKNRKAYNAEIERILRFAKKNKIKVDLPETPARVTKKQLNKVKKLKGKEILKISTVPTQQGAVNAYELFESVAGDKSFAQGKYEFNAARQGLENLATENVVSHEQWELQSFYEGLSKYRPYFVDIMHNWADKMINALGLDEFIEQLKDYEAEFGGISDFEAYDRTTLAVWLERFAARIDDEETRAAAYEEIDIIQNDSNFREEWENNTALYRSRSGYRSKMRRKKR